MKDDNTPPGRIFTELSPQDPRTFLTDFQTPVPVVNYMVDLIPPGCRRVLEPTPGIGRIVAELLDRGYHVTAPEDFFLLPKTRYDCVVMNPPFSSKYTIMDNAPAHFTHTGMRMSYFMLTECMLMADSVIALMPWFTISDSDVRMRNLKRYGIVSITALPRATFQYARVQTCILELRKGHREPTIFKVFGSVDNPEIF